jgi:hypothetical protein
MILLAATGAWSAANAAMDANVAIGFTHAERHLLIEARQEYADLVKFVSQLPGPVASESLLVLLQAGKPAPFETVMVKFAAEAGVFDETPLVKKTEQQFFDAFVLTEAPQRQFTKRMLDAIQRNYEPVPLKNAWFRVVVRKSAASPQLRGAEGRQ